MQPLAHISNMVLPVYIVMLARQATLVNLGAHCTLTNLCFPPLYSSYKADIM